MINYPDGCWRSFWNNGHEKDSKVIATKYESADSYKGLKYWYYTFRDEQGNITNEYFGELINK